MLSSCLKSAVNFSAAKSERVRTHNPRHLRRTASDPSLVQIEVITIISHTINIDNGNLRLAVDGWMRKTALDGAIKARSAYDAASDRLIEQDAAWDADIVGGLAYVEGCVEEVGEIERK